MVKIRRFNKRLFEDNNTTNNQQVTPPATNTTGTQPATDTTTTQPQNQTPVQTPAQPVTQQTQPNQTEQNDTQKAVSELLQSMSNTYWIMANNVPEIIKSKLPDFKPENQEAKPIIDLWDAFKKDPNENTFNAFINAFKNFGTPQQDPNNPIQPDTTTQNQVPQNNVSASIQYNFTAALQENLKRAIQDKQIASTFKTYF